MHRISQSEEPFHGAMHCSSVVTQNPGHVFDHYVGRCQYLGRTSNLEVQLVLGVLSSSMVVEIGVPLARRPCQQKIDTLSLERPKQTNFNWRRRTSEQRGHFR